MFYFILCKKSEKSKYIIFFFELYLLLLTRTYLLKTIKEYKQMKNLLSENMLRFGTKNLSESAKKELVLKSIMEAINEHGLHNAVKRQLQGVNEAVAGMPNAKLKGPDAPVTIPSRTLCDSGIDHMQLSVPLTNTSLQEAYIMEVNFWTNESDTGNIYRFIKVDNFNTTYGGKPYVGQADKVNYSAVPIAPKTATLNCILAWDMKTMGRYGAVDEVTGGRLVVTYNGGELEIPVTFGGFQRDTTGKVACDTKITLPKGF
jgi:hypothetical protein